MHLRQSYSSGETKRSLRLRDFVACIPANDFYLDKLLPWMTLIIGAGTMIGTITSYEMACKRFTAPFFILIFNIIITAILICFTKWEMYQDILSSDVANWISCHNLASLTRLTWFNSISAMIQLIVLLFLFCRKP